jgi:hypothetical protein
MIGVLVMAGSKNNIANKGEKVKGKFALSDDCEACQNKCKKGIVYLERYSVKREGNGVWCTQK